MKLDLLVKRLTSLTKICELYDPVLIFNQFPIFFHRRTLIVNMNDISKQTVSYVTNDRINLVNRMNNVLKNTKMQKNIL